MAGAPLRVRLGAWLLLGAWSAGLAEVLSGASPFLFVSAWGLLVTVPLYLLHAVVLVTVVHRATGRLSVGSLYLAGTLFGLYEAYVTKVLWTPTWDPIPVRVGGIHPFETALLVLFWHPVVAFVVPVLAVETLATRSRLALDGLPRRVRSALVGSPRRTLAVALLATATVQGALSTPPGATLGGNLVAGAVLVGGTLAWRRRVGAAEYALGDLLPDGRALAAAVGLLGALYVVLGVLLRPEFLPDLGAQATVWLLYAVLGGLLVSRLRVDRRAGAPEPSAAAAVDVSDRRLVAAAAAYVAVSVPATVLADPVAPAIYVAFYATALLVATLALGGVVRTLTRRPSPRGTGG